MLTATLLLAALAGQGSSPAAPERPAGAVGLADAATLIGDRKIVCGRVASVVSPGTPRDFAALNLTDGSAEKLAAIIPASDRSGFAPMFERQLIGREVCAEGKIEKPGPQVEMRVREPEQFKFIGQPVRSPISPQERSG